MACFSVTYPLFFITSIEVPGFALCSTTPKTPPGFKTAKVLEKISSILGPSQLCKFLNVKTASTDSKSPREESKSIISTLPYIGLLEIFCSKLALDLL